MFIGLDKLKDTAEAIHTTRDETVTLGVIPIFAYSVMPDAVGQLHSERQNLKIEISVRNTPDIVDANLPQQLDLGLNCPRHDYEGMLQDLSNNTRIVSYSDPAIASLARAAGLPAVVDAYTANIAVALGGVVVRPLQQQVEYPFAIIMRSTDSCSLAATALADAISEQLKLSCQGETEKVS